MTTDKADAMPGGLLLDGDQVGCAWTPSACERVRRNVGADIPYDDAVNIVMSQSRAATGRS